MPHWITIILDEEGKLDALVIPKHGDAGAQVVFDDEKDDRREVLQAYKQEDDEPVPGYGRVGMASYDFDHKTFKLTPLRG
jgi:hypothetical protein